MRSRQRQIQGTLHLSEKRAGGEVSKEEAHAPSTSKEQCRVVARCLVPFRHADPEMQQPCKDLLTFRQVSESSAFPVVITGMPQ
ncbi:hypothetical protein RPHASCH2410_CH19140 [Rhizobium phaseoli Ch24-10]|nr:hypothetical protein RPHASCH2410_CH19140 [Rhizobium phaseoli Ch24-10]